jgi:hypothetical protein
MSDRQTKQLETPGGHKVVLKEYITAREFLPIMKAVPTTPTAADNVEKGLNLIDVAVISIDGNSEKVSELAQDLPMEDYLFIVQEVTKLVNFQKTKN